MEVSSINDIREDFKNITFSKFQKSKAKNELIECIYNAKIENACYWTAEFICAGHFLDLWDIIIIYLSKYIHLGNPKLAIYIEMRYQNFITILNNGYANNIIALRNNQKIRKLFSEIICILCYSNKKHTYNKIKLNRNEEFDLVNISNKFKAPNTKYLENIFREDDPKELFIPINELIYSLTCKNIVDICFWYEWILEYENICKKKKTKCVCESRMYAPKNNQNDIIWLIWDTLFYYSNPNNKNNYNINNDDIINKIINSLYTLFVIKYNSSFKRKRKQLVYFAFSLLIENIDNNIKITNNNEKINAIINKIDTLYKDIKKNEISPNTDYLFTNLKKSNTEKLVEKLEIINNL